MNSNVKHYNVSGVTARLFDLIQRMSVAEQLTLLNEFGEKRLYPRKEYIMPVKYETREGSCCNYITDISRGGVFIMNVDALSVGEEVMLSFCLRGRNDPFEIDAKVAWKTSQGVGMQFIYASEKQQEIIKDFIEHMV